jgi:bile acid-coenzyme A ligase
MATAAVLSNYRQGDRVSDHVQTPLGVAIGELAAAHPSRIAITHERRSVTWDRLERRTNRLARAYAERGVEHGSFVTIALRNGIEFYESVIATWKLGATPQPISPKLSVHERDAIIELGQPALAVGLEPADVQLSCPVVPAGFDPDPLLSEEALPPVVAPSLKAPTSGGSTGRPKLIVSTQPAVLEAVTPFAELLGMTPGGVHLVTGPLSHNGPLLMSLCGLLVGCHVVVMSRFDALGTLELIERHQVDWLYQVPTMMLRIWRLSDKRREYDLSSLRIVMHMAAPCPPWLKQAWIDWLGADRIWELYAATELQSLTLISGGEWQTHPGSVGRPVIGEIQILDAIGQPGPPGMVGDIWMRRGAHEPPPYRYIGAEPNSRSGGWESVGDMGYIDEDGYLYLADRQTDMILVGGANVYPAEIEAALEEYPTVGSACVIGLPDEDLGSIPHALVQTDNEISFEELHAHLADRLAPYKIPRSFERVSEPLRDDAGKVRRSALRESRIEARRDG